MSRLSLFAAAVIVAAMAAPAAAQAGRIQGVVRDLNGDPIKGATVKATNPEASPAEFTAVTDDKGRFAIIGMRTAQTWKFVVSAEGYFDVDGSALIRSQMGPPVTFGMRRDPGPMPGALDKNISAQLVAAQALRADGRYDQAIATYQSIQKNNGRLTSVNLVLAGAYRDKARAEANAAARRTLLERAVAAYDALLKEDPGHARATAEREATLADLGVTR
jgi:tetratricopeptide (TPR) repeat protein